MSTLADITTALAKRGFEVVEKKEHPKQLRLMGRVPNDANIATNWLLVAHRLLTRSEMAAWKVDVSKQYILHGNRILYAWRLVFQSENMLAQYADVAGTLRSAPISNRVEVTEFPLSARANRNGGGTGRGQAGPVGTVRVGADAKRS